jgi:hypothetical protein
MFGIKKILLLVFGISMPRLMIVILALFTTWFNAVGSLIWVILGFIFLPYTLLWYSVVIHWYHGTWGPLQTGLLIVAIIFDVTPAKKLLGR